MVTKPRNFKSDFYYHIYNRGVEKRTIFETDRDYQRFLETIGYYLLDRTIPYTLFQEMSPTTQSHYLNPKGSGLEKRRVKTLAYCLMPNHFHLLLKPTRPDGITKFVSDISNSHTKYFNLKNERVGRLFQNTFKSKEVVDEPSLLQLIRYIHLNPALSSKTNPAGKQKPQDYPYSSYKKWLGTEPLEFVDEDELKNWLEYAGGPKEYHKFIEAKLDKNSALGIEDLVLE